MWDSMMLLSKILRCDGDVEVSELDIVLGRGCFRRFMHSLDWRINRIESLVRHCGCIDRQATSRIT